MRCPRCETKVLDEVVREGVTIDVCRECRGMWLDRGELERLIARERRDYDDDYEDYRRASESMPPRGQQHQQHQQYPKYKRRKSWVDSLGDLFD